MSDEQEIELAWRASVGSDHAHQRVLASLVSRHREAHRRYHGLHHVRWVLRHVGELGGDEPVVDMAAIVAAVCFHDAVYDPRASDNEAASARLARRELATCEWVPARVEAVAEMIEATAGHVHAGPTDPHHAAPGDVAVLLDADLAILGAPPAAYAAYVSGVRAEYSHVDDAAWRAGRGEVVRTLLERPALYRTPAARARWQVRARANLTAELAAMAAR